MGRGSSGGGSGRYGGGNGLNPADIKGTELMTWSGQRTKAEQDFFDVAQDLHNTYGNDVLPQDFFVIADIDPRARAIAYYDGANVGLNRNYMDDKMLTRVYADCVSSGFHPSNGSKSAAEAVAAHELGHRLTDAVGERMGGVTLREAATRIVNEARRSTSHRGVVQMAAKISKYATANNAEAIAEAFADVYCNGNNAHAESRAIMAVVNRYLGV